MKSLDAVPDIDWARLAAFIDGEGCIYIRKFTRQRCGRVSVDFSVGLQITNTDPRLMCWLSNTFGGRVAVFRRETRNARWKTRFDWFVQRKTAAELLRRCSQHLLLKREQADLVIAFQDTTLVGGRRKGLPRGTTLPPSVFAERQRIKETVSALNTRGVDSNLLDWRMPA